jgi:hypothetical protein
MRQCDACTLINASAAPGFPHYGQWNRSGSSPFPDENGMELKMTGRRKHARSRKTATRKTVRKSAARTTARKAHSRRSSPRKSSSNRWSQRVTRESDALDLKRGVFKQTSAKKIAASLKRSAQRSSRRKANAYRSALSMLTFYINRAGKTLPKTQRDRLQHAKIELRRQFHRDD